MLKVADRIPEILKRVDLNAFVLTLGGVEAKRSGGTTTYHCPNPAHEDRNPSFTVKDGRWKCWSACTTGGDAIDLLVWLKGCTKAEAIEELARQVGLRQKTGDTHETTQFADGNGRGLLQGWCRRRGWGPWVIDELGLSIVSDDYGRPRIRFPFRLGDQVPYHQDRAVNDSGKLRWLSPKGGRPIPYEADRLKLAQERGHIFVVEGVTDVVALVDVYTAPAVVGIPGVEAWRSSWAPAFEGLKVYVLADNDPAGERIRATLARDLTPVATAIRQVRVPAEHNDVDEWRRNVGPEKFDPQLEAAAEGASERRAA